MAEVRKKVMEDKYNTKSIKTKTKKKEVKEVKTTPKKKEVKVTVNMDKPGFGEDTRAERTGWEEGDEVVVYFGDPRFCLILKYNLS